MDKHQQIIDWLRLMGFDSEIPESLSSICNHSTAFIWDQLMQNGKPKHEVDSLRNNIIIRRLKTQPLNKQDEFSYPIKEIDLYIKRQSLESKLSNLKSAISEKRHRLNSLCQNNKIKYMLIEKLKGKIKENEERKYILDKKCKMLEKSIQEAEETLTCSKNLTPVELEENPNTREITETLHKCAEKLEKLLKSMPPPTTQNNSTQKSIRPFHSTQKQKKQQSTFEKIMTMSERKHSMQKRTVLKQAQSAIEIDQNKENIVIPRKINIQLFTDNDEGDKQNKRESLGILHESYLKDNDFLTVPESVNDVFASPLTFLREKKSNMQFQKPKTQHFDSDLSLFSQNRGNSVIFEHSHSNAIQKSLNYDKLYNNEFVINQLKTLLYNHNRQIIWNMIQTVNENFNAEVTRNITFKSELNYRHENVNQDDIAKLHFLHIQTELQTLKLKAVSKELCRKIDNKKKEAYTAIARRASSPERAKYIERLFEEQLADVGLDAVLVEMKKEINSAKKIEDSSDLKLILGKTAQVKDDIIQKIASIKHYISCIYETLHSTISTREQTVACVRKLGPFVEDLTWSTPLTENLCSKETRMFETFPLEYNRRCVFTDPRIYYRDISNSIPTDIELDADSIYMLTSILDSPFSPPETILLNILKCKIKMDALKSMKNYSMDVNYKKYSLKELQQQESYVQYALDRLNALMYSTTSSKTLATADVIKNVTDIWVQMPLKDFISPKRTVGEKDYKYYEKLYDGYYKNI